MWDDCCIRETIRFYMEEDTVITNSFIKLQHPVQKRTISIQKRDFEAQLINCVLSIHNFGRIRWEKLFLMWFSFN